MPSTVVHVALGGILAASLLGDEFDGRALAVVLGAAALPDLDTLLGWWIQGGHRAMLHTTLLPLVVGGVLVYDLRLRKRSAIRSRWGPRGTRIAVVSLAAFAVAGIGPDLLSNGVNVFYPLHDQFYRLDGHLLLSNQRGVVQTFVELPEPQPPGGGGGGGGAPNAGGTAVGSTQEVHYRTGFDAAAGEDPEDVERTFPIVQSGMELLVVLTGLLVTTARLRESHNR